MARCLQVIPFFLSVFFLATSAPAVSPVALAESHSNDSAIPKPVLIAADVGGNATVPDFTPAPASQALSDLASDADIEQVQLFPQRILPISKEPSNGVVSWIKQKLGTAPAPRAETNGQVIEILRRLQHSTNEAAIPDLQAFVDANTNSRWAPALRHELARRKFQLGQFTEATAEWDALWESLKDRRDSESLALGDEVLANLLDTYMGTSKADRLATLIGEAEMRRGNPVVDAKIWRAKKSVWLINHKGAQNVLCGPVALYCILDHKRTPGQKAFTPIRLNSVTDDHIATGLSITELKNYADTYNLGLQIAMKPAGAVIPTPAVMHSKAGHYSAVLGEARGKYFLEDRAMRFTGWVTLATLDAQGSGYFLIPKGQMPGGWQGVSDDAGKNVFGRHGDHGVQPPGQSVGQTTTTVGGNVSGPRDQWGNGGDRAGCSGMPTYTFHPQVGSVRIEDTPVGYAPPAGPNVFFSVAYNDLDDSSPASAPAFTNVGLIWSINWISYVDQISGPPYLGSKVTVHLSGGGIEISTYDDTKSQFGPNDRSFSIIKYSGTATYQRVLPDGSKEVFDTPDNATNPSRVFLTRRIDPQGNTISFGYDTKKRLVTITDSIGQVTRLAYTNASDIWKVTRVTDPFGRFATFTYNSSGQLSGITDVIGLKSGFVYDDSGFITAMTTPYGTTKFEKTSGAKPWDRTITVTDPQGGQERVQFIDPVDVPVSGPPLPSTVNVGGAQVPFFAENARLNFRNSFYWSKEAMMQAPGDFASARNYRWLTDTNGVISPVLEATKEPLEARVWFNYPDSGGSEDIYGYPAYPGKGAKPTRMLRILSDGTPQLRQTYYNELGNPTSTVDPLGRTTTYSYANNLLDVLEVRQKTGATSSDRLAAFTYNAQHLPTSITDAAGQVTTMTYNSRGQVLTVKDANLNTRTFVYNAQGYLTSINGPLTGNSDITSFTYDGFGRVRTVTNPDTYTLRFDYDALDRQTKITYPDGTYEQFVYDRLDRSSYRDRLGRLTVYQYDAVRQPVTVTDPLSRVTRFDWCHCGALRGVIDPMGRATAWHRDVQGRAIDKQYADGSKITYSYDTATSRLRQSIDEKQQVTTYGYNIDDTVSKTTYTKAVVATPAVSYTYDSNYNRIASMIDGSGTTKYSYNSIPALGAGKLAAVDGPLTNDTITYGYDKLGRVVNRAINGVSAATAYDPVGRTTSVTNDLGLFNYTYDGATSRLASAKLPNGQTATFTYFGNTGDHRLQQIANAKGAAILSKFGYTYNAAGSIQSWSQQAGSSASTIYTFGYDNADELTSAVLKQGSTTLKTYGYTYDKGENRLTETIDGTTRQCSYNALNELTTTSTGPASGGSYQWDALHRLTAIIRGTNRTEFAYDGLGRRVRIVEKQNGATVSDKRFLWCDLQICEERDSAGVTQKRFFAQGVKVLSGTTPGSYFYSRDHLGSVREMTDSIGTIRARYDYDPYGRRSQAIGDLSADFGFTGHYYHGASGLNLAPYRGYNADLGRWISRDPIGETGGLNLYTYVFNNPTGGSDLLGLFLSNVHDNITFQAARASGWSFLDAWVLARHVVAADFLPHSQDPDQAYRHAMAEGYVQTRLRAAAKTQEFMLSEVERYKNTGDIQALGNAIHAAQDEFAEGHDFSPWGGGLPSWSHVYEDAFPSQQSVKSATALTSSILNGIKSSVCPR